LIEKPGPHFREGPTQTAHGPLRSYGRIKTRAIKPRQAGLMQTLLPKLAIDLSRPIDLAAGPVWAEIGFGGGEHLAAQARAHPEVQFLGAEPFLNGVASCLRHIEEGALANVRLHPADGRDLIAALPDASLDRLFILFPDPWPKTRQQKRRLVQPEAVSEFARVLKLGGSLRFATDVASYADQALQRFNASGLFDWMAECASDWRGRPEDHVTTRYEEKRLGDCEPVFLDFVRR
jgi:tRNA (guanine-N7-)-methyltransferase